MTIRDGEAAQWDKNVVHEVILGDTYRLRKLEHLHPKTIMDIGGHIGTFSMLASHIWPEAEIIAVEPNHESFELLSSNLSKSKKTTCVEAAVGYEKNKCVLTDGKGASGGGFIISHEDEKRLDGHLVYRSLGEVNLVTIEELAKKAGWDHVDLIKLDCEGGEHGVFRNSKTPMKNLLGEYHMSPEAISDYLRHGWSNHFITIIGKPNIGNFWCLEHQEQSIQPGSWIAR